MSYLNSNVSVQNNGLYLDSTGNWSHIESTWNLNCLFNSNTCPTNAFLSNQSCFLNCTLQNNDTNLYLAINDSNSVIIQSSGNCSSLSSSCWTLFTPPVNWNPVSYLNISSLNGLLLAQCNINASGNFTPLPTNTILLDGYGSCSPYYSYCYINFEPTFSPS